MLYFDRIDVYEGVDVHKTSASKEFEISHYWHFLNYTFKFQPNFCNIFQDFLMISMNLSGFSFSNIEGSACCCIIILIRKNEAINLMQNADLTKKSKTL